MASRHRNRVTLVQALDAGIASEENIAWLLEHDWYYVVVPGPHSGPYGAEADG